MPRKASRKKASGFWGKLAKLLFGDDAKGPSKKRRPQRRKPGAKPRISRGKSSPLFLEHAEGNLVISPSPQNDWEAWQTFNPGVILLEDKVHFMYRAIGSDGLSRFGYAVSADGFVIDERLPRPVYAHQRAKPTFNYYSYASGGSFGGAEDPRLVRVSEEERIYMTYTACDEGLRVGLTSIRLDDFLQKRWNWKSPRLISPPGEAHKNWVLFPEKINGKYAMLTSINPKILITYLDNLEFDKGEHIKSYYGSACRKKCWDTYPRGAGAPPIKTKHGWLLFYHAIDERDPGKYKVGAMLLDLSDPTRILCRSKEPILEPQNRCENEGFKPGVVYVSGAVVKEGTLLIYYGGADSKVCAAHADFEGFVEELNKDREPKLAHQTLARKK